MRLTIPAPKLPAIGRLPQFSLPLRRISMRPTEVSLEEAEAAPDWFTGTFPEWLVYQWLEQRRVSFDFQSSLMGGRLELGGAVADFILGEHRIIIRVQGEYFHYGEIKREARDLVQKAALTDRGWTVVDVRAQDVLTQRDAVLRDAVRGVEWSR